MMLRENMVLVLTLLVIGIVSAANNTSVAPTTEKPTATPRPIPTTSGAPVTTPTLEEVCRSRNSSCDTCLKDAKCLWCKTNSKCVPYPTGDVLPKSSLCSLSEARWGVCWVNFEALIIAMGVIGGVIVLAITVCICCCCCCKKDNKNKYAKEDEKWERKKKERQEKANERRAERKSRTDEIRRKYGLMKDDNYQRFDNEA
ncbi:pituitary tumor-transforming gene 1 protein-interacting protein-like [Saccostrea echinata]|uniref:pituitary tumor-transforming gene 1 protein-interacting protein-like n=1 Tax=Saccostrea echinata TaxID=191078 RepID=UPI002A80765B|nr:pituitary tumor-transforming gene 1 protein-interacting protein-like [Saccostrea echinata]